MIDIEDARARGIALPSDDGVAQDVIDETEAWLASVIGPLDGERTETFDVRIPYWADYCDRYGGRLFLQRTTNAVEVTDGGSALSDVALVYNGSAIRRRDPLRFPLGWNGPLIEVTYTPNDALTVRRVLYVLLAMAVDEHADSPYSFEQIGQYSYSKGGGKNATVGINGTRLALAKSVLPRRPPGTTLPSRVESRYAYGYATVNP